MPTSMLSRSSRPDVVGRRLPPWWPLAVIVYGYPVWWLIGIDQLVPLVLAVPMMLAIWRTRPIVLPGGSVAWLLFLVFVLLSGFALFSDAPGAVPGWGFGRVAVFSYRLSWYLACTVVLLWIANSSRLDIPFRKLASILSWLFVITVVGGLLGVLSSNLELKSLLELALPRGIASNSFVKSLVHPGLADIQMVLGRPEARPKAPFPYANTWGAMFALSLPFFLVAWIRDGGRAQRVAAPVLLMAAAVPAVYSLNRGLWGSLIVGILFVAVLQAVKGRVAALIAVLAVVAVGASVLLASPLGSMIGERLENQHSNSRRAQLLEQTVQSTLEGSPVLGFGSTRDVQGSFASIAGGATPDCSACAVPPLGTQGHLWSVIFLHGFVGAFFFLLFFAQAAVRSVRCRTMSETIALCILLFFALQLFVYDTLGMPLYVIMIAIGAAWRDQSRWPQSERYLVRVMTARQLGEAIARGWKILTVSIVAGLFLGLGSAAVEPQRYSTRTAVLLTASPSYLPVEITGVREPRETTVDTEAGLVMAEGTIEEALGAEGAASAWQFRRSITITAEANTRVMNLDVVDVIPERALHRSVALANAYLESRSEYLAQRRAQMLSQLRERYHNLTVMGAGYPQGLSDVQRAELDEVGLAIDRVVLTPTSAGEVVRVGTPATVGRDYSRRAATGVAVGICVAGALILRKELARRRRTAY